MLIENCCYCDKQPIREIEEDPCGFMAPSYKLKCQNKECSFMPETGWFDNLLEAIVYWNEFCRS